jgi:hypothetical protein
VPMRRRWISGLRWASVLSMPPRNFARGFELSVSIRMIAATLMPNAPVANFDSFIARWTVGDGGQERANYQLFLSELCDVLEVPRPDQAAHDAALNIYAFERAVTFRERDGSTARGRIDLYRRGSFVLEAKQSRRPGTEKAAQSSLFDPEPERPPRLAGALPPAPGTFSC